MGMAGGGALPSGTVLCLPSCVVPQDCLTRTSFAPQPLSSCDARGETLGGWRGDAGGWRGDPEWSRLEAGGRRWRETLEAGGETLGG